MAGFTQTRDMAAHIVQLEAHINAILTHWPNRIKTDPALHAAIAAARAYLNNEPTE